MKKILTWLGLGYLGYKAYQRFAVDISKLQDWTYTIQDVFFTSVTAQSIQGTILWNFNNKSSQAGRIKDVNIDILYQGIIVGYVSSPGPYLVPGNGTAQVDTSFNLNLGVVGAKALQLISDLASSNDVQLQLKGSVRASGVSGFFVRIPIDINTTAKTIYSYFK